MRNDLFDTGIDTIVDEVKKRVNLDAETEALLEQALCVAAKHGMDAAEQLVQALRQRWEGDAV